MRLSNAIGIRCDKCYKPCTDRFIYYSVDLRKLVKGPRIPNYTNTLARSVVDSFDHCAGCYDQFTQLIVEHNKQPKPQHCELTGQPFTNNYFYGVYDRVTIDSSLAVSVCVNCGKHTIKCDKCPESVIRQICEPQIESAVLEFSFNDVVYNDWCEVRKNGSKSV